jgi:hypothetical protein
MRKVTQKSRNAEVARTWRIPVGADVHHRHLENPSIEYLARAIRDTKAQVSSGECHPDWGAKRLKALQKLLDVKERKLQKKREGK